MTDRLDISKELRDSGLKVTVSRQRILQLFHDGKTKHLSADDVYRILLSEKSDVGVATIYRVLLQFADAGILTRQHFELGSAVFELNMGHHHDHLICTSCGNVEEFIDDQIELRQKQVAKERGFEIHEHSLSLYGTCAACKRSKK